MANDVNHQSPLQTLADAQQNRHTSIHKTWSTVAARKHEALSTSSAHAKKGKVRSSKKRPGEVRCAYDCRRGDATS